MAPPLKHSHLYIYYIVYCLLTQVLISITFKQFLVGYEQRGLFTNSVTELQKLFPNVLFVIRNFLTCFESARYWGLTESEVLKKFSRNDLPRPVHERMSTPRGWEGIDLAMATKERTAQ